MTKTIGPLMLDVAGTSLNVEDKELLAHPLVGGLILFTRNFESAEQVTALVDDIRAAANGDILISVDQEGGRVQRFKQGFTRLPPLAEVARYNWPADVGAEQAGWLLGYLMAKEVQSVGVDISFAPVLDLHGISEVIGDRSFSAEKKEVSRLASAYIDGMLNAGMKATGKHFPGHGSVKEDSHFALPIDKRSKAEIFNQDLYPFKQLISAGKLNALMPAHVIYPDVCQRSVGFSSNWLQTMLRQELGFDGVIFSDDLSMAGAASIGDPIDRAEQAQVAGCDMLLVCNDRDSLIRVIDRANLTVDEKSSMRLRQMLKDNTKVTPYGALANDRLVQRARALVERYWQAIN